MVDEKISCPKCNSDDYIFTKETKVYTCNNCKHKFTIISCPKCGSINLSYNKEMKVYTCNKYKHVFTMVFISYGHDEYSDLAFKIEKDLKKEGFITWIDKELTRAVGEKWEVRIVDGLEGTKMLLLMMTPHSVKREDGFCLNELSYANQLGHKIIPIMVAEVIPPLSIHRIQYLDFRDWVDMSEEIYKKKLTIIVDVLKGKKLSFDGRNSAIQNLLEPIDFGAEIIKHTKDFYGREWIFEIIDNWVNSKSQSNVFLLTGKPGVGKTAISAMLCKKYSDCAVYHLTKYNHKIKSDAFECVLSLAYQLSTRIPEYAEQLLTMNIGNIRVYSQISDYALTMFDKFIVQPLNKLSTPPKNILIIIDAIDEATKDNKNELAQLIAENLDSMPSWLKFFITTRPINKIITLFSSFDPVRLKAEEARNLKDIEGYLRMSLADLFEDKIVNNAVEVILKKSKGIFLYIWHVVNEIKIGRLDIENPETFPQGLNGIYQMFFQRHFPDLGNFNEYQKPLLDIISAAYEPLNVSLIKDILGDTNRKFKQRIESMGSLLEIENKVVKPFHQSLIEWITSEDTSVDYYIDKEEGHKILLNFGWKTYQSDVSLMPHYFLVHLPQHFLVFKDQKSQDQLIEVLSDYNYIITCYRVGLIFTLMRTISALSGKKEMPVKDLLLSTNKGLIITKEGELEGDVRSASIAAAQDLSIRILSIYNQDEYSFIFIESENKSCQIFSTGNPVAKYLEIPRPLNDEETYILTVFFDKSVILEVILLNYLQEINLEKEQSMLKKFKAVYKTQKKIEEKFIQWRKFDEKFTQKLREDEEALKAMILDNLSEYESYIKETSLIPTWIQTHIQFVLKNFDCIHQIMFIAKTGLGLIDAKRSEPWADVFSASPATLLVLGHKLGLEEPEYMIIGGKKTFIIIMPLGKKFFLSFFIKGIQEFQNYLDEFMRYLKDLRDLIEIVENSFKKSWRIALC